MSGEMFGDRKFRRISFRPVVPEKRVITYNFIGRDG